MIAWATTSLLGDSLIALRLPSALAIAAVVVLTALLAREFGARPGAQVLAAGCTAVSGVVVGLDRATLDGLFASVTPAAQIDNRVGLHTAEQGRTVWVCREQRTPWSQAWPRLRQIG